MSLPREKTIDRSVQTFVPHVASSMYSDGLAGNVLRMNGSANASGVRCGLRNGEASSLTSPNVAGVTRNGQSWMSVDVLVAE